jgi:hypothetical protein
MNEPLVIDLFVPDFEQHCINCGQTPVVTGVHLGKVVYNSEMCGPCVWGEAKAIDPSTWNE